MDEAKKKKKNVTLESQIGRGTKRIQQEVRLRSKARRNQSLHFKLEGLEPGDTQRNSLKVGDGEVETKEQRYTYEARQLEVCVCESLATDGCSFVKAGLSGEGWGGFLRN